MPARIIALAVLLFAGSAQAATLHVTLTGESLSLDVPCARHIGIVPDASLHNQVLVDASADRQEELDPLALQSLRAATIGVQPHGCARRALVQEPTLTLAIRVPAGFALSVEAAGAGDIDIGAVGGPLAFDLSGAGDVTAAAATSLNLQLSGSGGVSLGQVNGAASISMSGHGKVSIASATMPSMAAQLSGAGELSVAGGRIGNVSLSISGVGDVRIGASVGDARADLSGVGSVRLKQVTGQLSKNVSGLGSVTVGD